MKNLKKVMLAKNQELRKQKRKSLQIGIFQPNPNVYRFNKKNSEIKFGDKIGKRNSKRGGSMQVDGKFQFWSKLNIYSFLFSHFYSLI